MAGVIVLADIGEWIPAYVGLGLVFLVATVGAAGLGVWVMRGDARNRAAQRSRQSATGGSGATAESERRSDDQSGSLTEEKAP
jgi:ribosomal protein S3